MTIARSCQINAVGSNSEAYSDDREQVMAERPLVSRVSCRSCRDSVRGGMRTITLR